MYTVAYFIQLLLPHYGSGERFCALNRGTVLKDSFDASSIAGGDRYFGRGILAFFLLHPSFPSTEVYAF